MADRSMCSLGDGEPVIARGWCAKHYRAWKKHGDPLAVGKLGRPPGPVNLCSIDSRDGPVFGRGWCQMHYARWRRYGDPLATKRIIGDVEARFWSKVDKDGPVPAHRPDLGPCWIWTDVPNDMGYGVFGIGQKVVKAYRWSYERFVGPIPAGLMPDHLCRNPPCVRPDHLEPVTNRENVLRGARTKVSDEVAAALHARWRTGEKSVDLAAEVGTHRTNLLKRFRRIDEAAMTLPATPPPDGALF